MFNINGAVKFKYIPNYRDMRGGYEKLSGVVRELSGGAMEEGTAYVFTSRNQKLVKVVRHEQVPHTSVTAQGLAGLATRRFQYGNTTGSEMYHMQNEKLKISKQTFLNWLKEGGEFIVGILPFIKRKLLTPNTVVYCDETWVDVKVKGKDGKFHYLKRYMWVLVNLTTNMCYYLYGSRKRSVIEEFLRGFVGTLMTDAYAAYAYFNKIMDCTHVCCWAHARRIFYYAFKDYKDKFAKAFLDLIECLYKIEVEHIIFHRTEEEIVNIRKKEAIPILHTLNQKATELLSKYDEILCVK